MFTTVGARLSAMLVMSGSVPGSRPTVIVLGVVWALLSSQPTDQARPTEIMSAKVFMGRVRTCDLCFMLLLELRSWERFNDER
jgi:hypothetical protein